MRLLRILLFSFLALLVLLVGGFVGFWWLGGPEAHRWAAHKVLETVFDRDIHVDGTLEVELGTEPALNLTDLRIDNPSWAEKPMLQIERAEIQIALRPLLERVLLFPRIALEGVTVDLETASTGRHSWVSDTTPKAPEPTRPGVFAVPLFETLSVSNATVTYRDQRGGRRTTVHVKSLTERRDDASGQMKLDASGDINGEAFKIVGESGGLETALAATDPYPLELDFQLPAIDAKLEGTIADVIRAKGLDLRLDVQSPSLHTAAQAWNLNLPGDAKITGEAKLTGDLADLSLTDLDAEMTNSGGDHLKLSGDLGDVWEGSGLDASLTLKLDPKGELTRVLPEDWRIWDRLEAAAKIAGDVAKPVFDQVSADLHGPGNSSLKLAGKIQLAFADGRAALDSFDLTSTLAVPEPSAFADQLGFDPSAIGALRGEAELTLADQKIEIPRLKIDAKDFGALQIEARGPVGTLTAERTLNLKPSISLTAKMAKSGPLLALVDAKAPELGPVDVAGQLMRDDQGYRLEQLKFDLGAPDKVALKAEGSVGSLIADDVGATGLDLTVQFEWPSSHVLRSFIGQDFPELGKAQGKFGLAGTIGSLRIDAAHLETKRDDGVVVIAKGGVASVQTATPLKVDGVAFDLEAQAPSTTVVAQLFGYEAPDFGPVHARANLGDSEGSMALESIKFVTGSADEPSIQVTGAIGDVLAFEKVELGGEFKIPTNDLLAFADIHGKSEVGRLHGKIHLSNGDGSMGVEHLEAEVKETHLLSFTMEGLIDDLENLDQVKFETSLEVPNIANLANVFDADGSGLERFRFDGKLSGDDRQFDADGKAALGETHLAGDLAGDFRGARPSFKGRLHSPHVRLVDLGLKPEATPDASQAAEVKEAEANASKQKLFGSEALPIERLQDFDLDLEVQLDNIEGIEVAIDQARANVTLKDGTLKLSPLQFALVGGRTEINAEVDARGPTPKWRVRAETDDIKLDDLWRQLRTEVPLGGELALVLDLQANGKSPRDLADSLDGDLHLALQRGQIESRLFGLTTMNPLRWLVARSTRRGYSEIDCFVARFQAENGVAEVGTLVLDTPNAIATGKGSIDFARETIDLQIQPQAKQRRLVALATPFTIKGNLANPSVKANTAGATARMVGQVAFSPINLLGSILPFVSDGGKDKDNPCLKWAASDAAPKSPSTPLETDTTTSEFSVEGMAPAIYAATTASHVRDGPGTTYTVIKTLAKGATVNVTGRVEGLDWYRVGLANGDIGFIWAKLLEPAEQADAR